MGLIVEVIQHYYPGWQPPARKAGWSKCLCPFHAEERASASISFDANAFKCHACGVRGNYITVVMRQEGVPYAKAKRIAEEIAAGSNGEIPQQPARQPSRRIFGEARPGVPVDTGDSARVPAGVRGRSTPWT